MAGILQQLSGNPLSTAIGQKIEQATDPSLTESDWALNMEICDMINDTDEGPKDAVRAIKKRLQQNAGKNHTVVMYTLTILETCVKNCGKRFHLLVTQKDFVQDLFKIIGPKYDPPPAVQEKVLSLIQIWADTFRGQSEFSGVTQAYNELKQKGIEFPATTSEPVVPIHTPQRSVPVNQQTPRNLPAAAPVNTNQHPPRAVQKPHTPRQVMSGPLSLSTEQITKLKAELDVVQGNIKVFNEMLNELTPGKEHKDDWELLYQLHSTCQSMQKRIVDLIEKVANEEITVDLLRINDEINSVFLRFEKFLKLRNQGKNFKGEEKEKNSEEPSLIDFAEDSAAAGPTSASDISLKISNLQVGNNDASGAHTAATSTVTATATATATVAAAAATTTTTGDADFDVFAQSRSDKNTKNNDNAELQREEDFNEMEEWLQSQSSQQAAASIPGSEFDRFLAERASAADRLPASQPAQQSKPKEDPFGL